MRPSGFRRPSRRSRNPQACWRPAATCRPERLLAAYRRGIFPWYSPGQPVLWWSPDPRAVLFPEEFHLSRSLAKTLQRGAFAASLDEDFEGVIDGCAAPRACKSGHLDHARDARRLPAAAPARACAQHRDLPGRDAGRRPLRGAPGRGVLRGVDVQPPSAMPPRPRSRTWWRCARRNALAVIDCQLPSQHLASLGARTIPRSQFQALLAEHAHAGAGALASP